MENQTRFDLNAAVENWRQELTAQTALTLDNRRELETHLRDALAELKARGLSDEESFWIARRRVGQPQKLADEFSKANPVLIWRERLFWIGLASFLSSVVGNLCTGLSFAILQANSQNSNFWLREVFPMCLWLISALVPLLVLISLANGRLISSFQKLRPLIQSRQRLALAAAVLGISSIGIRWLGASLYYSRINLRMNGSLLQTIHPALQLLLTGIFLVWLLPAKESQLAQSA